MFHLDVTVPPNASAEVWVPTADVSSVRESGRTLDQAQDVRVVRQDAGRAVIEAGSGRYAFSAAAPALTPAGER